MKKNQQELPQVRVNRKLSYQEVEKALDNFGVKLSNSVCVMETYNNEK